MLQHFLEEGPWFEPKRIGYGAGLPIAWQGWALLVTHVACILGVAFALRHQTGALAVLSLAIALLPLPIYARRTRGGWKWRNGSRD